eukprot:12615496-Heterocapsa_arctica.AAC.1
MYFTSAPKVLHKCFKSVPKVSESRKPRRRNVADDRTAPSAAQASRHTLACRLSTDRPATN